MNKGYAYLGLFLVSFLFLFVLGCQKEREKGISDEELFGTGAEMPTGAAQVVDLSSHGLPARYTLDDLCKTASVSSCTESSTGIITFRSKNLGSGKRVDSCVDTSVAYNYRCVKVTSKSYLERCLVV